VLMLESNRMTLMLLEDEDTHYIVRWRNQSEIRRQFFDKSLISFSGQREWFKKLLADDRRQIYLARLKPGGEPIGIIGLYDMDRVNHKAELGSIIIGDRQMWNQGLASEMIGCLLDYAFTDLNMNRIYAYAVESNSGSIRALQKCGLQREGVLREALAYNGLYYNVVLMGMVRSDRRNT
jgi:RimJ/RimL family protein N-acetyltransferase